VCVLGLESPSYVAGVLVSVLGLESPSYVAGALVGELGLESPSYGSYSDVFRPYGSLVFA